MPPFQGLLGWPLIPTADAVGYFLWPRWGLRGLSPASAQVDTRASFPVVRSLSGSKERPRVSRARSALRVFVSLAKREARPRRYIFPRPGNRLPRAARGNEGCEPAQCVDMHGEMVVSL